MKLLGTGELSIRTRSLNDQERDPIARHARIKSERERARMRALIAVPPRHWPSGALSKVPRFVVALTRVSPATSKLLDEHDNLRGALKHVVDGICDHLGVDDGNTARIRFEYSQERGPWAVRFTVSADEQLEAADVH